METTTNSHDALLDQAARLIDAAEGVLVSAGAGMGIDSGLPDFRGGAGFWGAYPALGRAKLGFESIANPAAFKADPRLAWGFYGHRLNLYRRTVPHDGFRILREIMAMKDGGGFVFTTNVDGHFRKAGFADGMVCEAHGSIHHLQCLARCSNRIWPAADLEPLVDEDTCLLLNDPPTCPDCGGLARPNILMFGDWDWLSTRERIQSRALVAWRARAKRRVVIEIGAGSAIPTARIESHNAGGVLIRINPKESRVPGDRDVGLPMGALEALSAIAIRLGIPLLA